VGPLPAGNLEEQGLAAVHALEGQALPAEAEARLTGLELDLPCARELLQLNTSELKQVDGRLQVKKTCGLLNG